MMSRSVRIWGPIAGFAALFAGPATAGSLRVDPVQVVITDDRQAAAVSLTNNEDVPVTVHVYPLGWTQSDGRDVYSKTDAVIVSPRVATISPRGTQLVRVGFRNPAIANGAWRLIIEEVPEQRSDTSGVRVALRMNLPLFARLDAGESSDLRWSAWRDDDGVWTVEATNKSASYVRLEATDFVESTGIQHDSSVRLGVVLPNSRRLWRLRGPAVIDADQFQRIARAERADDHVAVASAHH